MYHHVPSRRVGKGFFLPTNMPQRPRVVGNASLLPTLPETTPDHPRPPETSPWHYHPGTPS